MFATSGHNGIVTTMFRTSYAAILLIILAAVLAGFRVSNLDTISGIDDDTRHPGCYEDAEVYLIFSFLFANVAFAVFVESRVERTTDNYWDCVGVPLVFGSVIMVWSFLDVYPFYLCERPHTATFMCEFVQMILSYPANIALVSLAPYVNHKHLHLETLYLLSLVLVAELCQIQYQWQGHYHAYAVFLYFNIKVGLVIFEAYLDAPWTDMDLSGTDPWIWLFFIGGKLVKQFYYTTPQGIRFGKPYGHSYSEMFWIGSTSELVCLLLMISKVMRRSSDRGSLGLELAKRQELENPV
jgi:hypothetical protein